ncbi:MAG: tetratricopeptide repeat protein [Calditrichaeota bacterium]|nr:tetratricopeptide repeat protein [Calditrichota bacterium]
MRELKKILGTSLMSLLLVIWGLFMVCSGRVPDVNYDDDIFADDSEFDNGSTGNENSDLMAQLAVLDEESTRLDDNQRNEILAALGISDNGSRLSRSEEEDFLSEELFLDLEVEIAELEKVSGQKVAIADSLRREVEETEYQLLALNNLVSPSKTQFTSSSRLTATAPMYVSNGSTSAYAVGYQDALNAVYARDYNEAIAKFRELLRMENTDNLADNAQYWIGESYYAMRQYEVALAEFERVFAFEDNNKIDDAQFMLGMAYIRLGDASTAQIELENLMAFFQDSEYVVRAELEFNSLNI